MLLYRGKLYGVNSEELLQTILEYTRGVQVVPAGTELALRMGLPGVYRMMTKESADGPDVIQGDDFSWTPDADGGGCFRLRGPHLVRQGPVGRPGALAGIRPGRADRPAAHGKRLHETERRRAGTGIPGGRDVSDGGVRVSDAGDAQPVSPVGGAAAIPG